jgi:hypothetical protein
MINPTTMTTLLAVGAVAIATLLWAICVLLVAWVLERSADRWLRIKGEAEKALEAVRFYSDKLSAQHVLAGLIPRRKKEDA